MALTLKILAAGQVTAMGGVDIYTPTVSQQKNILVKSIIFTNTDTASRNVEVALTIGTTDYLVHKSSAVGAGSQLVFTKELTLDMRDATAKKIKVNASVGNKIHYVITGAEKDV